MKKIIIIGSGGFAIEVYSLLKKYYGDKIKKNILGFISKEKKGIVVENKKVLGNDNFLIKEFSKVNLILAIGNINLRKKTYVKLKKYNFFWPNIYPKNLKFETSNIKIGFGNIFCSNSLISPKVKIGDFNIINMNSIISHHCTINNFCNINPASVISGNVKIENNCEIGSNSVIHQNLKIKANSKIGIGAVLISNTEKGKTYFGNPARSI